MTTSPQPEPEFVTPAREGEPAGPSASRREALQAVARYAAFVAPAAIVLLDATSASAQPCSQHPNPKPPKNCTP